MNKFIERREKKVVVLGLDGVPCSLLNRFADDGIMPSVKKLRDMGTLCAMTASIPEVSSTSWSTFMTGVNPGRHGIYGFMELRRDNYGWRFPNFNDLMSKTIWEILAGEGKKSIVLNIPSTYPARPMNGMIVSGFVALDLQKACYPDRLYEYLKGIGYRLDVDARKAVDRVDDFALDISETFKKRVEAVNYLFDTGGWDLFVAAVTETDRLHHYLWSALEDSSHPQHDYFLRFYHELDKFIGAFYEKIGPDIPFIMLSDHGFTRIKKEIYLNAFLQERGYLKFASTNPQSFGDMESNSAAFVLDPSRVYIHRKDNYVRGCVNEQNYERLRASLKEDLLSLSINGERVISRVFFKEEIYSGDLLSYAPDLVALPYKGYDLKGSISKKELSGNGPLTGGHTREDALFYINRRATCGEPNIVDVGSTILKLMGIQTAGLDGTPLI